jgi:hypothetical protein
MKAKQYRIKSSEITWSKDQDARLKRLYDKQTQWSHIAILFKCSYSTVHRRLRVLNILPNKWTPKQDQILRDSFATKTNQELASEVKVNALYVADRIAYLGLIRKQGRPKKQINVK